MSEFSAQKKLLIEGLYKKDVYTGKKKKEKTQNVLRIEDDGSRNEEAGLFDSSSE